jgi:tagatose-1,6-bisphosphate aldolase non-catalytic subunit AgaZ/GatZ
MGNQLFTSNHVPRQNDLVSYKYIQDIIEDRNSVLINTLDDSITTQACLILSSIHAIDEIDVIDKILSNADSLGRTTETVEIVIYGKNSTDMSTWVKYNQLIDYGFERVKIYTGGLFEWMLLQDIYGDDLFPTTAPNRDILKFC